MDRFGIRVFVKPLYVGSSVLKWPIGIKIINNAVSGKKWTRAVVVLENSKSGLKKYCLLIKIDFQTVHRINNSIHCFYLKNTFN